MNASARTARQIIKSRRTARKDARRPHTLAGHARLAGLGASEASSVSGALRSKAKACGITGEAARMFRRNSQGQKLWRQPVRNARRYTKAEFLSLATAYRPRAPKFVSARQTLTAYASS